MFSPSRSPITEVIRESCKDEILRILDELKDDLATQRPCLADADADTDTDTDTSTDADADDEPLAKRGRVAEIRKPSMAVDLSLDITDADLSTSLRAHRFALKMVQGESMLVTASLTNCASLLIGFLMAAAMTPFAALYLDFDPTKRAYRSVRDTVRLAMETHIGLCFEESCLPQHKQLTLDVCSRWHNPDKTPLQQLFNGRVSALIDLAMEKITQQLQLNRATYKEHVLVFARTRFFKMTVPEGWARAPHSYGHRLELPTIEIVCKSLPINILPKVGKQDIGGSEPPLRIVYAPSGTERMVVSRSVDEKDYEGDGARRAVLNAVKYEMTMWACDESIVGLDMQTQTCRTDKTIVVDLVHGLGAHE